VVAEEKTVEKIVLADAVVAVQFVAKLLDITVAGLPEEIVGTETYREENHHDTNDDECHDYGLTDDI
jgi:hypothetical protein